MLRCGANYSTAYEALPTSPLVQEEEQEENENFAISNTTRYTLAGIYLACSLLAAAVIAIFVDPLSRYLAHLPLLCFDFLKELFLCHIVGFFSSFFPVSPSFCLYLCQYFFFLIVAFLIYQYFAHIDRFIVFDIVWHCQI